jgi:hypothetical protein
MKPAALFCLLAAVAAWLVAAVPAAANGFRPIGDRDSFLSAVEGRKLTRFGIALDVTSAGEIRGEAFGRPVTGAWRWRDGYFCRDLYWGQRDLGPNCQAVLLDGRVIRFVSDQGAGQYADLRLDR